MQVVLLDQLKKEKKKIFIVKQEKWVMNFNTVIELESKMAEYSGAP